MSLPPLLPLGSPTDAEFRRRVSDLVNAIARKSIDSGTTAERPKNATAGTHYYDETLGIPVWKHASGTWRNAAGAVV